jgi:helix-turn-helix, Psq domain
MSSDRRTSPPEFLADLRLPAYLQQHQLQQAQYHQQHHGQGVQGQGGSGQNQKPEWKRYKQYTRNDIMSAIECVRNGMSALQASRKFGVPSRTLYDKVKKLGITTGTPRNRSSMKREGREGAGPSSSSAAFPYGIGGSAGAFGLYPNQDNQLSQSQDFDPELEEMKHHQRVSQHPASLIDPSIFLQKALEARDFRGDALQAMALAAATHAQFNGIGQTSPNRQSPSLLAKYMERNIEAEMNRERERNRSNGEHTEIKREPVEESDEEMETSDRAENLSLSKRESPPVITASPVHAPSFVQTLIEQPRGVIVPPMKYASPRSEPTSTTPPASEHPLIFDKIEFKQNLTDDSPIAFTPTTTASYDE